MRGIFVWFAAMTIGGCAVGAGLDSEDPQGAPDGGETDARGPSPLAGDAQSGEPPRDAATAGDARADGSDPAPDTGLDARADGGVDAQADAGVDARADARVDARADAGLDAALDAPADAPREGAVDAGCATGGHVLINEVRMESAANPLDQFVEVFNPTSCVILLSGYRLVTRAAHGTGDTALWAGTSSHSIAPGGYFLLGGSAYTGTRDGSLASTVLPRSGAGLALASGTTIVDSVGWGSATNAYVRGSPAPAPSLLQSIARRPTGHDSQDNWNDFSATARQTPRAAN